MIKAAKRFKTQEKSSWQGKKSEEKEKNRVLRKELLMQHLKVMLILKFSSETIHADDVVHAMNDEISQTSLQIVKQIEAILEVIL